MSNEKKTSNLYKRYLITFAIIKNNSTSHQQFTVTEIMGDSKSSCEFIQRLTSTEWPLKNLYLYNSR